MAGVAGAPVCCAAARLHAPLHPPPPLLSHHHLQVDYHSFEGILYCAPILGWLLQHCLRAAITAHILGSTRLAAAAWPRLEAWLRAALPGGARSVAALRA